MLPFQRLALHKRISAQHYFLLQLFGLVVVVHIVFLFLFFFVYKSHSETAHIALSHELTKNNASIVYVPWMKRVPPKKRAAKKTSIQTCTQTKKKPTPKKIEKKASTSVQSLPQKKQKKAPPPKAKKVVAKNNPKEIDKTKDKKNEQPEKKKEQNTAQPKEKTEEVAKKVEDVQYIGREEKAALELHAVITQEVVHYWQPPVGFDLDEPCVVSFVVDWSGKPQNIVIKKSSGMPAIDLAARQAVEECTFGELARGKTVTLELE